MFQKTIPQPRLLHFSLFYHNPTITRNLTIQSKTVKSFKSLPLTLQTQKQLDQIIPLIAPQRVNYPCLEEQDEFTPHQLRLIAFHLAANNLSPNNYETVRSIGESINEHFIRGRSNEFIKALFSTSPVGEGSCPTIYISPNVTKVAYNALGSYEPEVMIKVISDGLARVSVALAKLGTAEDVFKLFGDADPTPLVVFKEKYIDSIYIPQSENSSINTSMSLLTALSKKLDKQQGSMRRDALVTHLILIPYLTSGGTMSSVDLDKSLALIPQSIEEGEIKELTKSLLNGSIDHLPEPIQVSPPEL